MNPPTTDELLPSCVCTQARLTSPRFQEWAVLLGEANWMHRKIWEWCFIAAALDERGLLGTGKRGLGFAVGQEPLPALFASMGCEIVATDLDRPRAADAGWVKTDQHCANLSELNSRGLCDAADFAERVSFRHVDMNAIPVDLRGFDFVWSSCSLEHLGSLAHGEQFLYNSLACLKPGGWAVHTTEYNVSSNTQTSDYRSTVLYRRCDLERMAATTLAAGHRMAPLDLAVGDLPADQIIDTPPYSHDPHLKLLLKRKFVCTSVGVIIERCSDRIPVAPRFVTRRNLRALLRPWGTRVKRFFARRPAA